MDETDARRWVHMRMDWQSRRGERRARKGLHTLGRQQGEWGVQKLGLEGELFGAHELGEQEQSGTGLGGEPFGAHELGEQEQSWTGLGGEPFGVRVQRGRQGAPGRQGQGLGGSSSRGLVAHAYSSLRGWVSWEAGACW